MMLIAVWPLVIALVGLLLFMLASNAKVSEIGKWLFIIGTFWLVSGLSTHVLHIGTSR